MYQPLSDERLAELAKDVMGRIGWAFEPLVCIPTTELRSMLTEIQARREGEKEFVRKASAEFRQHMIDRGIWPAEQQPEAKHDA